MSEYEHKVRLGDMIHLVPTTAQDGISAVFPHDCVAAFVTAAPKGKLHPVSAAVLVPGGKVITPITAQYSKEGHQSTYHLPDECPFPPEERYKNYQEDDF